jgi:pyruvate dehydrogenase E2 component (dihydrolipoamide acetyltransferase)
MYGVDSFSAIINPPQSCIMSVGSMKLKPICEDGIIKAANIINITLSCDHRVIDGAVGAELLRYIAQHIENPFLLINL